MSMNDFVKNAYDSLLDRIKNWIAKKEIKITHLAKKIGKSRQTLYDYLNGVKIIPKDIELMLIFLMEHPEEPIK